MKYKQIRGVAHNLGYSFLSDANAVMRDDVYTIVPAVLFKAATAASTPRVVIDLLNETVEPPTLSIPELTQSLAFYHAWLPKLLVSHGVDAEVIRAATITIDFDYNKSRRSESHPMEVIPDFTCTVRLTDDRGVEHEAVPEKWWRM